MHWETYYRKKSGTFLPIDLSSCLGNTSYEIYQKRWQFVVLSPKLFCFFKFCLLSSSFTYLQTVNPIATHICIGITLKATFVQNRLTKVDVVAYFKKASIDLKTVGNIFCFLYIIFDFSLPLLMSLSECLFLSNKFLSFFLFFLIYSLLRLLDRVVQIGIYLYYSFPFTTYADFPKWDLLLV